MHYEETNKKVSPLQMVSFFGFIIVNLVPPVGWVVLVFIGLFWVFVRKQQDLTYMKYAFIAATFITLLSGATAYTNGYLDKQGLIIALVYTVLYSTWAYFALYKGFTKYREKIETSGLFG